MFPPSLSLPTMRPRPASTVLFGSCNPTKVEKLTHYRQLLLEHGEYQRIRELSVEEARCTQQLQQTDVRARALLQKIRDARGSAAKQQASEAYQKFQTGLEPLKKEQRETETTLMSMQDEWKEIEKRVAETAGLGRCPTFREFEAAGVETSGILFMEGNRPLAPYTRIEGAPVLHIPTRRVGTPVRPESPED